VVPSFATTIVPFFAILNVNCLFVPAAEIRLLWVAQHLRRTTREGLRYRYAHLRGPAN